MLSHSGRDMGPLHTTAQGHTGHSRDRRTSSWKGQYSRGKNYQFRGRTGGSGRIFSPEGNIYEYRKTHTLIPIGKWLPIAWIRFLPTVNYCRKHQKGSKVMRDGSLQQIYSAPLNLIRGTNPVYICTHN